MRRGGLKGSRAGCFSSALQPEAAPADFEPVRGGRGGQEDWEGDVWKLCIMWQVSL